MKYNTKYSDDRKKAQIYFDKLISGKKRIELTEIRPRRTNLQNRYLHVLFSLFGIEFGLTTEEAKYAVKIALDYVYVKKGKTFVCQTSKMSTKELSIFIDKFRAFASQQGCYLPDSDEYTGRYEYYDNIIEQNKKYL